jgi:hypothetical protein
MDRNTAAAAAGAALLFLLAVALACSWARPVARADTDSPYPSPIATAFSPDGKLLAVADPGTGQLLLLDPAAGKTVKEVRVGGEPNGLAWTPDGKKVFVSELAAGVVAEVDCGQGQVARRFKVGPGPIGLAVAPGKNLLLVCNSWEASVSAVDLAGGQEKARIPVVTQPFSVAVTPDESLAVATNLVPLCDSTDAQAAACISLIDLRSLKKLADLPLPQGSTNCRTVKVSPDGRWAYAVHTLGKTTLPTTQLDRGWISTNALTIVDLKERKLHATVLLDQLSAGAADPWGVAVAKDGAALWISIAGAHQLMRIDARRLHVLLEGQSPEQQAVRAAAAQAAQTPPAPPTKPGPAPTPSKTTTPPTKTGTTPTPTKGAPTPTKAAPPPAPPKAPPPPPPPYVAPLPTVWQEIARDPAARAKLAYDLAALYGAGLSNRTDLPGKGPRGLDVSPDGKTLAVPMYFTGAVALVDAVSGAPRATVATGPEKQPDQVRLGETFFHDGKRCFQGWLTCSTCHPDGRADGLNWDLLNDGLGNPKNARSLLLADKTPPSMSLGVRDSMETATKSGFRFIQFVELPQADIEVVQAYIRSLRPRKSPYLTPAGELSARAQRGKALFESPNTGCARCHPAPLYTDCKRYDVGTHGPFDYDADKQFDTPTLIESWRTAPYLHDGRARTILEALKEFNKGDKHGRTSQLTEEQLRDLAEFCLSL